MVPAPVKAPPVFCCNAPFKLIFPALVEAADRIKVLFALTNKVLLELTASAPVVVILQLAVVVFVVDEAIFNPTNVSVPLVLLID